MNGNPWRQAFFVMLAFILGNSVAFVVFGLNAVSKGEFDKAQTSLVNRLDAEDGSIRALEKTNANLVGQLVARGEISVPPDHGE